MSRLRVKSLVWILRPAGDGAGNRLRDGAGDRLRDGAGDVEVLLLERPGRRGGGFHPVTGNAERGEAPFDAAQREALEETGLRGELVDLRFQHEFQGPRARFVEHAFLLVVPAGAEVGLSDEHVHALWTGRADAAARIAWDAHRATLLLALAAWDERAGVVRLKRGG